jgi:hypothetical protein
MVDEARGDRSTAEVLPAKGGDGYHRYGPHTIVRQVPDFVDEPVAVGAGHGEIGHDDVKCLGGQRAQSVGRAGGGDDVGAACGERDREQLRGVFIVVDDQDSHPPQHARQWRSMRSRKLGGSCDEFFVVSGRLTNRHPYRATLTGRSGERLERWRPAEASESPHD